VKDCLAAAKQAQARGAKSDAAAHLAQAIELNERTKEAIPRGTWFELGVMLYDLRRFDAAEALLRKAVVRQPKDFALNNLLGVVLKNLGKYPDAIRYLDAAQKADGKNLSPLINKGNVYLAQRDGPRAVETYSLIVRREPRNAEYQRLLGNAYRHMGEHQKALRQYEISRTLDPKDTNSWLDAAGLLALTAKNDEAIQVLDTGMGAAKDRKRLAEAKVAILRRSGRVDEAVAFLEAELARDPKQAWVQSQLAHCFMSTDRRKANEYFRAALALEPENPQFLLELAESLDRTRGPDEGPNIEEGYRFAKRRLALGPSTINEARTLRNVLHRSCDFETEDGLGAFTQLGDYWASAGDIHAIHSLMSHVKTLEHRRLIVEYHRRCGQLIDMIARSAPITKPAVQTRRNKIRIGFMSSDLRDHPVSYFALPIFEQYDREQYEVYCYSFYTGQEDGVQKYIRGKVDGFHLKPGISDQDAAQLIANDELDILFELGGTTDMNKLNVMAWRPARLQASWLGYPHSAGLETIDYILVDPFINPPQGGLLIEKPFEMARSWVVLSPLRFRDNIPIEPTSPQDRKGHVTFGTMNNPVKYNREMLGVWAETVRQVEDSRFLFVRPEGATEPFRDNVRKVFAEHGVSGDRVEFTAVRGAHLQHYNQIDIALDSFPQTGGTTTCESLWMGVPTVTYVGDAFFERLSYSNLSNAGLGDLCTFSHEDFIKVSVALAADRERRSGLRRTLRDDIRSNPLGRTDWFVEDFLTTTRRVVEASR
jgi:protein O-GlcNAc transferase